MSLRRRLRTVTLDLPGACPLAYCPPGRDLVVGYLYPRALPPVTHSSALQAPERIQASGDMDTYPHWTEAAYNTPLSILTGHDASHSALLPGGQYPE